MKISECSFCGKLSLTENDICSDCHAAAIQTETTSEQNNVNVGEVVPPPQETPQRSNNVNQTHESRNKYTPVYCWRCEAMNNWEQSKICYKCGCALRPYKKEETITLQGEPITSFPLFRSSAALLTVIILVIAATLFVKNFDITTFNKPASSDVASNTAASKEVKLPQEGWYKPSIWNFYRQKPTVDEILEKNNQATSKTLKSSDVQTLSLKGKLSFAEGGCATDECVEELKKRDSAAYENWIFKNRNSQNGEQFKIGLSDNFEENNFQLIGSIDAYQKSPDKVLRKIFVTAINQSRKTEKTEGFDGFTGWRKTVVFDQQKLPETSVIELKGNELSELKNATGALKTDYSSKNLTFYKMSYFKNKVQFVLQKHDLGKQELMYFDALTGLITKIESYEMTCFFSDYADYEGVRLPSTMYFRTVQISGNFIIMKIENIIWSVNKPMEDSMFAKP
jgi:hypothetical protein